MAQDECCSTHRIRQQLNHCDLQCDHILCVCVLANTSFIIRTGISVVQLESHVYVSHLSLGPKPQGVNHQSSQ